MILIIQNKDTNSNISDYENIIVLKSICDVKTYTEKQYTIILIDIIIDEDGVLEKYNFSIEELFVMLNIVAIITNTRSLHLQNICKYYKIPLIELRYWK